MNVFDLVARLTLDAKAYENGLKQQSTNTSSFGTKMGGAFSTMAKVGVTAMATLTAEIGAGTKKLIDGVSAVAEYGDNIDKMSQKMGMSSTAYQEWDFILQHSGSSMEAMKASMKTLANSAQSNSEAFERLGISQQQIANLSQEELFGEVIKGLQNVEDTTERTYLSGQLLGRGATELGALLNTSAEDTEKMRQSVHDLGGVMSETAVKDAARFQDSLQDAQYAINGLKNNLLSQLLPSFSDVIDGFTELVSGTGDGFKKIEDGIRKAINNLTKMLPKFLEIGKSIITSLAKGLVQNLPDIIKTLADLAIDIIHSIVEILPDIIKAIMTVIPMLIQSLAEALPDIIKEIARAIPIIIDAILNALPTIIEALLTALPDIMIAIIEALPDIFEGIATAIIDNFPAILEAIGKGFLKILEKLGEFFAQLVGITDEEGDGILDDIGDWFVNLFVKIGEWFKGIIDSVAKFFTDVWNKIKKFFTDTWNNIVGFFTNIVNKVNSFFTDTWNKVTGFFTNVWNGVTTSLNNLWNNITGWFTNLWNRISGFVSDAWNWGVNMVKNIWNGFTSWASNVWNNITSWFSNLWSSITNVFSNAWEVGKNIVVGIWNGIADWFSWLWDRISGFFDDIWQGIKDFFGIQSPSKQMAWIGNMLVQGLGNGIEDNAPKVLGTMENLAEDMNDIMDGMSGDIALNAVGTVESGVKSREDQLQEQLVNVTALLERYLPYIAMPQELQLDNKVIAGRLAPSMDNEFAGMQTRQNRGVVAWT